MDRGLVLTELCTSDPSSVGHGRSCPETSFRDDPGRVGTGLTVDFRRCHTDMRSLKTPRNSDCPGTTAIRRVFGTTSGTATLNRSRHW